MGRDHSVPLKELDDLLEKLIQEKDENNKDKIRHEIVDYFFKKYGFTYNENDNKESLTSDNVEKKEKSFKSNIDME